IPRIFNADQGEAFTFSTCSIWLSIPLADGAQASRQVAEKVRNIFCPPQGEFSPSAMMQSLGFASVDNFEKLYLRQTLEAAILKRAIPNKSKSRLLNYRLTEKGGELQNPLKQTKRK